MSDENGSRLPREGNDPPAGTSPDGPPPVYARPGLRPEAGAPAEPAPPRRWAGCATAPQSVPPDEAVREAAATPSESPAVPRRAARNRARRSRRRGLLRLAAVAAVVVAAVVVAVVLATAGDPVASTTTTEQVDPIRYADDIARVAEQYDLDPYLVAAVARTESSYDADAVSAAGAVGLMQLMPDTAAWIVQLESWRGSEDPVLTDPATSLRCPHFRGAAPPATPLTMGRAHRFAGPGGPG